MRTLLKNEAYREIKKRILDERFAAGSFLAERSLARELGMSKTPIGAAIARLETEGFVAVSPQQGIVVRELSFQEIVDAFDTRIAVEAHVVAQLAGKLSRERIARARVLLDAQGVSAESRDIPRYVELDTGFHLMLSSFLGNQELDAVIARQCERLQRVIRRVLRQDPARLLASGREHASILRALEDGNGGEAATLIRQHLEFAKRYLISP